VEKLRWLNGLWLREDLDDEQLVQRLQDWALNKDMLMALLPHLKQRIEVFTDIAPLTAFFLSGMLPISKDSFAGSALSEEELAEMLQCCLWRLEAEQNWQRDALFNDLKSLATGLEFRMKDFMPPLFIAIAGTTASVSVVDSMEILGPDISRARLRHAVEVLGGVGKKRLKKLEKRYQTALSSHS